MTEKSKTTVDEHIISEMDQYLFGQGTHYEIYKKLGAHSCIENGKEGVYFAVWAPNATQVSVVGSFNEWNESINIMKCLGEGGIYALFVENAKEGDLYKFVIFTKSGQLLYKSDPYANYAQLRPESASIVTNIKRFKWTDANWMEERKKKDIQSKPFALYECHIGSWMRHPHTDCEGYYNYREFAAKIIEYLKEMKYTHIELMGIAEYPYDGSWGYQVTGYFAPTSRYGTPEDFMHLINALHKNNIGVILDWVPAHFPKDAHGLSEFDGTCLYEHPDKRLGEHADWGTKIFNYGKNEVKNFLISNALYWIKEYHIDGLRVDAVASMLYLNYGKEDGQWVANKYGGFENLEAIEFFKHFNSIISKYDKGVITIAEESTAWPQVTTDVEKGGLGFTFKWNMGWMHDFCEYMKLDPIFRKENHHKLTFAMSYNSSENYIMPLSHDEVVHLKCSMVNKMPGFTQDKYANLRVGYTYMFGHSGKKLLFMGQDFGQEREWSENRELDWNLLDQPLNKGLKEYVKNLLGLYHKYPAFHTIDNSWEGFEWVNVNDGERSTYSFVRKDDTGKNRILVVLNMTPLKREQYRIGVSSKKKVKLLLNSDEIKYGGSGSKIPSEITPDKKPCDNRDYSIEIDLPGYGAIIFLLP